ncbi:MAG: PilZ domain-containing protein [Candidatus Omnitrophota bacterium]|jgi:hypothetical protein
MDDLDSKLVQDKWVGTMDLVAAKQEAARYGKSLWAAFVKLGYLSEEDIALFFSILSNIPYVKISDYEIDPGVLSLADEDFYRENLVLPMFKIRNILFVACANPLDTGLIDNINQISNCDIEPLLASADAIVSALNYYYGPPQKDFEIEKFMIRQNTLKGLAFWRESERLRLEIPLCIRVEDSSLALHHAPVIECRTTNISRNGAAVGAQVLLFLPKGVYVSMEFKLEGGGAEPRIIKAKGEIVHSHMEKDRHYFLGIKLISVDKNEVQELIDLSEK